MKKIISLFLSIVMIVSVFSVANVEAYAKSGSCGKDAKYTFDKSTGALVISGKGAVEEKAYNYYDWFTYSEKIKSVKIKDGITSVENGAFFYCENLSKVELADSVTNIGDGVFRYTPKLKSIKLSKKLKTLGREAFSLSGLTKVTIPSSATKISSSAFSDCKNLKEIIVDKNNKNYSSNNGILFNKSKTRLVTYPAGKTSSSYHIPRTVTKISSMAFSYSQIKYLEIPRSVKEIGGFAFINCDNLVTVVFKEGIEKVGEYMFSGCDKLRNVHLPASLTEVSPHMFDGCVSLKNIFLPIGIEKVEYGAFKNCYNLRKVAITRGLKEISWSAFYDDYSETVDIGDDEGDYVEERPLNIDTVYCCHTKKFKETISVDEGNKGLMNANWVSHKEHYYSFYQEKGTTTKNGQKITRCECGYFDCKIYSKISSVKLSKTSYKYNGKAKKPTVTVKDGRGNTITNDNYAVSYSNNIKVGKATVTVKFKNNYSGTVKKTFKIVK